MISWKQLIPMLFGTKGATLLGNVSTGKGVTRAVEGTSTIKAGQDF